MKRTTRILVIAALAAWLVPSDAGAADIAKGKEVYTTNCESCHGATGEGDGPVGAAMKGTPNEPRNFAKGEFKFDANKDGTPGADEDLRLVIKNGAGAYGGAYLMAPWPTLSDEQVNDIVAYIRSLKK